MIDCGSQGGSDIRANLLVLVVYLGRAGKVEVPLGRCEWGCFGRKMINVSITAWQDDPGRPIAKARAQFLVKD